MLLVIAMIWRDRGVLLQSSELVADCLSSKSETLSVIAFSGSLIGNLRLSRFSIRKAIFSSLNLS